MRGLMDERMNGSVSGRVGVHVLVCLDFRCISVVDIGDLQLSWFNNRGFGCGGVWCKATKLGQTQAIVKACGGVDPKLRV